MKIKPEYKSHNLRLAVIKAAQLDKCQELLTIAGVPVTVEFANGDIAQDAASRLKWFLLRRKWVTKYEKEQPTDYYSKLQTLANT